MNLLQKTCLPLLFSLTACGGGGDGANEMPLMPWETSQGVCSFDTEAIANEYGESCRIIMIQNILDGMPWPEKSWPSSENVQ